MDLSELKEASIIVKDQEGLKFEHLQSEEKCSNFGKALIECSKVTSKDQPSYSTTFNDTFLLTALFNNVNTPYANVVGSVNRKVVIISKLVDPVANDGGRGVSPNDTCLESSLDEPIIDNGSKEVHPSFNVYHHSSVPITSSIKQKAVYITTDEIFLQTPAASLFLVDLGAEPISCDEAHHFCSLYALNCHGNDCWEELPDIWVLTRGRTVSMGCCLDVSTKTLNTYMLIDGSTIIVPDSNTYSLSLDSDPFNRRTGIAKITSFKKRNKIVTARYKFSPTSIDLDLPAQMTSSNGICISLDFIWNGKDACFSPPTAIAETVVGVSVTPGYQLSPVLPVFNEVSTLLKLCDIANGKSSWVTTYDSDEEEMLQTSRKNSLSSKVKAFLEDASTQMLKSVDVSVLSPTVEMSPFQPREDLDFLGQLWMFLRNITNIEDLLVSLGAIFKVIILGKIQPFIHQSKSSTLAVLFRQCLSCGSIDRREVIATKLQCLLTEEKALACLVEIGIEKLQRDFTAFFTLGGLTTAGDLDVFFDSTDYIQQCHNLCNLQYVLELATVLSTFVSLSLSSLSLFVRDTLKYYHKVSFDHFVSSPTFNIYFPSMSSGSKTLINMASSLKPAQWSATIMEDGHPNQRQRMFCLEEPLFKYLSTSSLTEDHNNTIVHLYHLKHQSVKL